MQPTAIHVARCMICVC